MKNLVRYFILLIAALPITIIFQNCGQPGSIASNVGVQVLSGDPNLPEEPPYTPEVDPDGNFIVKSLPSTKFICEPFGNGGTTTVKSGLKAQIAFIERDAKLATKAGDDEKAIRNTYRAYDYFNSNKAGLVKNDTPLFMSQLNAPTRQFDRGFQLSDGNYLTYAGGDKMVEYFALKIESILKLSETDQEGYYEIATFSDDGSRLYLGSGAEQSLHINIDENVHSTKMGCSTQAVYMTKASRIPMLYYYSQGPANEIANVMAWKFLGSNPNIMKHSLCDIASSDKWWKPADSSPAENWLKVSDDGYKILTSGNFELPDGMINPCAAQNTNLITKAVFSKLTDLKATLSLEFGQAANIKATLYKVVGTQKTMVKAYDFSAQLKDKITVDMPTLELNVNYTLEVLLVIPSSGTQVLNEVPFQVVKK